MLFHQVCQERRQGNRYLIGRDKTQFNNLHLSCNPNQICCTTSKDSLDFYSYSGQIKERILHHLCYLGRGQAVKPLSFPGAKPFLLSRYVGLNFRQNSNVQWLFLS